MPELAKVPAFEHASVGCRFKSKCCPLPVRAWRHRCALTCSKTESKLAPEIVALPYISNSMDEFRLGMITNVY